MKKIFYVLATLIATGCIKTVDTTKFVHFTAINGESTKTVLNGKAVDWVSTDQISIIDHLNQNNQFTMRSCSGSSASFVGNVSTGAPDGYQYTAIYPYGSYNVSGSTISGFSIPAEQTGVKGSFPAGLNFSCATGNAEGVLTFNNLLTLLKFNVGEGANVHDIVITSNNGEPLSGTFSIQDGAVCNVSGSSTISLNPSGSVFDPGDYYISALPGVLEGGVEVKLTSTSGYTTTKSTSAQVQLNPSKILTIYNAKPVRNGSISGSAPLESIVAALKEVSAISEGKGKYWEAGFKVGDINWTINVHSSKGNKELAADGNLVFNGSAITISIGHNGNCEIDKITFKCNSSASISKLILTISNLNNITATIGGQTCTVTQSNATNVWEITPPSPASGEVVVTASVAANAAGQVVFTSLEVFN